MSENIRKMAGSIKNPLTGKSLEEEGRLIECVEKDGGLFITYFREGIDPTAKRRIEDAFVLSFKNQYSEEKIWVKTVSKDSGDVYSKEEEKQSASLKIGHGSVGKKRKVLNADRVICVSSCKGGVGKSTVAVNLALSLTHLKKRVGLLDADIYGPSLPTLLNQSSAQPKSTGNKKIEPIKAYGLEFISFGLFIPESDPVIWRGPMLGGVLNQFLFDVEWSPLDYLIVDLPPGTGDIQLSLVQNVEIDGAIIVSTPQKVALLDTKKGLNMFKKMNIPILGMIENMSYFVPEDDREKKYYIFGKDGVKKSAKELGIPFIGEIPLEIALQETSDQGNPYMNHKNFENRPVWKSYMKISREIDNLLKKDLGKGGIWNRLFK